MPDSGHWSEREVNVGAFKDARLGNRFVELLRCLGDRMVGTLPLACQVWASTKAAYRFFSNPRVEDGDILSGHFDATRTRFLASEGTVLLLQDTTEFTYQRRKPDPGRKNIPCAIDTTPVPQARKRCAALAVGQIRQVAAPILPNAIAETSFHAYQRSTV